MTASAGRLVGAERDLEPQQAADDDDQILERAMALLADRSLTVVDQRARGRNIGHALDQESAEAFPRGVEPWRIVEAADEQEQFVEGDAHCARASTVGPDGAGTPGAGSSVTRTPTIGRGASGGLSVASVTRPEASGATVPRLIGAAAVSSQI